MRSGPALFPADETWAAAGKDLRGRDQGRGPYVHNIKPASERLVAGLAFVGKIGEIEPTDPDRQFVSPMSADEDAAGNLFILDDRESCVKKFDAKREFLGRFGRKGQGPGEFEFPMSVGVTASGRVIVATGTSEFHVFDNDGIYVDRFRLPLLQGYKPGCPGLGPRRRLRLPARGNKRTG
ncbi:MAG: hypothetical protein M0C28_14910 [Candidatus Moduliflexus flocculans]|nr:hypothetical protein [Candidatus Moduliflexus flocculans]